jgi:Flp pilus assembly protein protease CpaA
MRMPVIKIPEAKLMKSGSFLLLVIALSSLATLVPNKLISRLAVAFVIVLCIAGASGMLG